jgi:cytochrome c
MSYRSRAVTAAGIASLLGLAAISPVEPQRTPSIQRGERLVSTHCASCHAIGPLEESPRPGAPPFRTLGQRYPVRDLQEALAEGIVTAHPAMPEFTFSAEETADIIAYLESLPSGDGGRQP